jgi:hypothetical protein
VIHAFGESGDDYAQCFEVRCAAFGHLHVVDRGQLRIELAGGVGGLDQLAAQGAVPALLIGWFLRAVLPVSLALGASPVKDSLGNYLGLRFEDRAVISSVGPGDGPAAVPLRWPV